VISSNAGPAEASGSAASAALAKGAEPTQSAAKTVRKSNDRQEAHSLNGAEAVISILSPDISYMVR
jgi:hypothetical protein